MVERCEKHAWVSVGVAADGGTVTRIWECEHCPAWTRERLDAEQEVDWDQTWLSEL